MVSQSVHVAWGSIELLHNVVRTLSTLTEQGLPLPVVRYRAKVKLHGSNCAVQVADGGALFTQSRTAMLTPESDYKGFAAWVRDHRDYFAALRPGLVIFGEWCGPGVEKGMAISQVADKQFAVFAVRDGDTIHHDPADIRALLPTTGAPDTLHVLPWHGDTITIDYASRDSLAAAAADLNHRVAAVEHEDPWVKQTFGLSGLGEGLVFYPVDVDDHPARATPEALAGLMFKAKGDKHRTAGTKVAVQIEPTAAASVGEFVALMVPEARLEQALTSTSDGVVDMRNIGKFLTWLVADVRKESIAELEASHLTWSQVEKPVQTRAREWFLARRT